MEPKDRLPLELRAAYLALHRCSDMQFAKLGVTADQFVLLATLARGHALTQRELAARMPSDPSTVRAMLVLLEERGLVSRNTHPTDGRARTVALTAVGAAEIPAGLESRPGHQGPDGEFFERRRDEITRETSAARIQITCGRHDGHGGRLYRERELKGPSMQKLITMCGLLLCTVAAIPAQERADATATPDAAAGQSRASATARSPATPWRPWRLRRTHRAWS